ncbi:TonB-dependent receptor [Rugamonas sp. CCM 8940]|uniref:TonB-dependent receptor n=1 Tax=Rugamonas sp. CCM 8940 TaxID=2765359 RepID=UPI0018F40D16|nr:TonB-dependent receptor [Rugamonas sp. CCM 8940]MBJ7311162.1 TonB-dependent receptor [Rugamonas sp. CCM 8940]
MKKFTLHASALAAVTAAVCPPGHGQTQTQSTLSTIEVTASRSGGATLGLDAANGTGSRLGLSARETPASVSTLGSADMAERSLTRAQDAAVRLPGVSEAPAPGNGGTSLVARGFAGHNSVAQMVDGTRLIVASGTITYPFSSWPLEAVEVLRGPASVLYGDGAIGAAVNYVTKQPRFDRRQGEAFLSAGSYGAVQGGIGLRGPLSDTVAYSVYADAEQGDGYRRDMAYKRQNLSAAVTLRPNRDLHVTLSLDAGHNDDAHYFGTPLRNGQLDERLRRTSFNVDDALAVYNDRMWRARVEYQAAPGVRLRNETYYLTSKRHWRNAEAYAFNGAGPLVNRGDYLEILHDQEQLGNRFDAVVDGHVAGLANRFVAGFDWYRSKLLHSSNAPYGGGSVVDPFDFAPGRFISPVPTLPGRRAVLQTGALFAEDVLDLTPSWKLVAGLRRDSMDFDNQDLRSGVALTKSYSPVTGRLGAIWAVTPQLSLYGQYGTGTDPLSGALALPNGSTSYDLTKGRQLEAGAKGSIPAMRGEWSAALYKIEKRNILSRDADNPNITLQIGQQSSTGVELAFAAEPLRGWTVDANLALLRARYDDFNEVVAGKAVSRGGNTPSGVPQRTANLWTGYRFLPQWQAGLGARHVGLRQSNTANTSNLPSYTLFDAALSYQYSSSLSLTLALKNLADRDYALSGSGGARWLMGAPRTAQLTARSSF